MFEQDCAITSGAESCLKGHHLLYLEQQWEGNIIKHYNIIQYKPRDFLPTLSVHPPQEEMPFLKSPVPVISRAPGMLTLTHSVRYQGKGAGSVIQHLTCETLQSCNFYSSHTRKLWINININNTFFKRLLKENENFSNVQLVLLLLFIAANLITIAFFW